MIIKLFGGPLDGKWIDVDDDATIIHHLTRMTRSVLDAAKPCDMLPVAQYTVYRGQSCFEPGRLWKFAVLAGTTPTDAMAAESHPRNRPPRLIVHDEFDGRGWPKRVKA